MWCCGTHMSHKPDNVPTSQITGFTKIKPKPKSQNMKKILEAQLRYSLLTKSLQLWERCAPILYIFALRPDMSCIQVCVCMYVCVHAYWPVHTDWVNCVCVGVHQQRRSRGRCAPRELDHRPLLIRKKTHTHRKHEYSVLGCKSNN